MGSGATLTPPPPPPPPLVSLTVLRPKHRLSDTCLMPHPPHVACRPRRGSVSAAQKAEPMAIAASRARLGSQACRGGSLHIPHQRAPHSTRHRHYRLRRVTRRATTGRHRSSLVPSYSQSQASQLQPSTKSHPQTPSYPQPLGPARLSVAPWIHVPRLMGLPRPYWPVVVSFAVVGKWLFWPVPRVRALHGPRSAGRALQVDGLLTKDLG